MGGLPILWYQEFAVSRFVLRGCPRCGGDLFLNEGDWQCLQCGRYWFNRRPQAAAPSAFLSFWRERAGHSDGGPSAAEEKSA